MAFARTKFGLYLHVPYCAALCPYCDFAKTANFTPGLTAAYHDALNQHVAAWLALPAVGASGGFSSVFFGGGTPSLFSAEYAPLFAQLQPHLRDETEVSLEANPDDLTPAKLAAWRTMGVNRLSVGVQTFDAAGLRLLGRTHSSELAKERIAAALEVLPQLNIDLIYGWPGQTPDIWQRDLATACALGVPHLSLYCLTYESRTPLGRQAHRGLVRPLGEDPLADAYIAARELLAGAGYEHEEVSNWAKPGASCSHNWLYWQDHSYIGVGPGAHGYLASDEGPGVRYAYARNDRLFSQRPLGAPAEHAASLEPAALAARFGVEVDAERDWDSWLTELVGAGLRTRQGVDLAAALRRTGQLWRPTPVLAAGLAQGLLHLDPAGRLRLLPEEWFREAGWGVEVLRSCLSTSNA